MGFSLLSGAVPTTNTNFSVAGYILPSELEKSLGTPTANGSVLASNTDGVRYWTTDIGVDTVSAQTVNVADSINIGSAVVNSSFFSGQANSAQYAFGKTESSLSVNNAIYLNNKPEEFYTNANNITTGTLAETRLPFRMDQNVRKADSVEFHDLVLTGNVTIGGNVTTITANNIITTENMIYLNANVHNVNPDVGFAASYDDGTYSHAGFFRDASDGIWKVYDGYVPEPDASIYIDTANDTFRIADFQANNLIVGGIIANGSPGTIGQALTTDGTRVYWSSGLGYAGSVGYTGSVGAQGPQGYTGSVGVQGPQGFQGYTGSAGYNGSTGYAGSVGAQGPQGYTGSIGYTGSAGYTGSTGYVGSRGTTLISSTPPISPSSGDTWWDSDDGIRYIFYNDGTSQQWVQESAVGPIGPTGYTGSAGRVTLPVGFFFTVTPTSSETLLLYTAVESFSFANNFGGSQGTVGTNPTSSFVLTIQKNGSNVGTATISTGGSVTFNSNNVSVSMTSGDRLKVVAPGVADATVADVSITLKGSI